MITLIIFSIGCKNLVNLLGIENWYINGNINSAKYSFSGCSNLSNLNLMSNWDTNNISDISGMFSGCNNLSINSINNIINFCLNTVSVMYRNLSVSNSYSPFYLSNITNDKYQSRWSELTAAGWTF